MSSTFRVLSSKIAALTFAVITELSVYRPGAFLGFGWMHSRRSRPAPAAPGAFAPSEPRSSRASPLRLPLLVSDDAASVPLAPTGQEAAAVRLSPPGRTSLPLHRTVAGRPGGRSLSREGLPAITRVSPASPAEHSHYEQHDQKRLSCPCSSPPSRKVSLRRLRASREGRAGPGRLPHAPCPVVVRGANRPHPQEACNTRSIALLSRLWEVFRPVEWTQLGGRLRHLRSGRRQARPTRGIGAAPRSRRLGRIRVLARAPGRRRARAKRLARSGRGLNRKACGAASASRHNGVDFSQPSSGTSGAGPAQFLGSIRAPILEPRIQELRNSQDRSNPAAAPAHPIGDHWRAKRHGPTSGCEPDSFVRISQPKYPKWNLLRASRIAW